MRESRWDERERERERKTVCGNATLRGMRTCTRVYIYVYDVRTYGAHTRLFLSPSRAPAHLRKSETPRRFRAELFLARGELRQRGIIIYGETSPARGGKKMTDARARARR